MNKRSSTIRIAIIGTGGMANTHAGEFAKIPGCKLVAAADIDAARVKAFAEKHDIPRIFTRAGDLLKNVEVDAVSIVTPDPFHANLAIECLRAGKHVLCEKPLALNHADASRMVAAARKARRIHMVNFSYRNWPAIHGIAKVIQSGEIGEIRHVEASYLQAWLASKVWGDWHNTPALLWRLSSRHGSKGVLGDVGVHILDFATFPVGPISKVYCRLKAFHKAPRNRIGEYTLDANDSATINVEFGNGALGVIHTTRWAGGHANNLTLKIFGAKGGVEFNSEISDNTFRLCSGANLDKCKWKDVKAPRVPNMYQRFIASIRANKQGQPDFIRGAEIQKILDSCFESNKRNQPVKL
ncbi:MAG: Gfo/Idh/MocA family oxidoreductase [Methylacidiphilales bacterium]|nr:Gfo/Idh/MocA family oxidoreductase [Candidatus Methylacidiphilales bacterium]